jgi:PIN domain nuclease of toxin-antitoxin system
MIYLDTHAVVWLYAGEVERFTRMGCRLLEKEDLFISPIVQLELQYLYETDRISEESALILESLERSLGLTFCDQPFPDVVIESVRQSWTRDPFDRLIVAQALIRNAPLLTKDRTIRHHYPLAQW